MRSFVSGRRVRRIIVAVTLAAVTTVAGCGGDAATEEGDVVSPVVTAGTATVTIQPFSETVDAVGAVAPRPGHIVSLSAPSPTRVARVHVTAGESVAAGQPLIEFDQAVFRAATEGAEAVLAAAERAHERAQRLAEQGIAPRKDVEQAAADLAKARTDAVAARRDEQLSILRSPIAGVVTRMDATLGASVDPSQPLVEVADPSAFDVIVPVTSTDAVRIRRGATVRLDAGDATHRESLGLGIVGDISAMIDSSTRSVAVRIEAPRTGRRLRLGETIHAQIVVAVHPGARVIPIEALVPEGDAYRVFVVDSAGVAHARPVTVGGRTSSVAEIVDGLEVGERVVTTGAYGVDDGVKIVEATAPPPP
jgi:RND family efflux transporter MFP subunit